MAATPSLKITKSFAYKGGTKLWSNRYHFAGGTPSGSGPWTTLADAVVAAEKLIFDANMTIVSATGYAAGSDVPVFSKSYSVAGTLAPAETYWTQAGNVAFLMKYTTTQRTSKNHPVYLFNYYHGALAHNAHPADTLTTTQVSAVNTYATAWLTGFSDGTNTLLRAGPNGAVAQTRLLETYLTHRDFRK